MALREKKKCCVILVFFLFVCFGGFFSVCSDKKLLRFQPRRPNTAGLANNKKSNKSYGTWEFKVPRATWSACHVQLTFLSGMPVVSSVDEILCPRRWLSRGTRTNRKIFHCVSISNGEWGEEGIRRGGGGGRSSNRSLPVELIAYSENNVPYPRFSEGRALAEATFFLLLASSKRRALRGTGRIRGFSSVPFRPGKIIRSAEPNAANLCPN